MKEERMHGKNWRMRWGAISTIIALCVIGVAVPKADAEWNAQMAGGRVWYVDWEFGGIDYGGAPMYMLSYVASFDNWYLSVIGGYGDGWEAEVSDILNEIASQGVINIADYPPPQNSTAERMDLQWAFGRQFMFDHFNLDLGPFVAGLSYHYIEWDFDSPLGKAETYYHGPELLVGWTEAFGPSGLAFRATATFFPYVTYTTSSPRLLGVDEGDTTGFFYDVGLMYQVQSTPVLVAGGYRQVSVASDGDLFDEDDFKGAYLEIGTYW
jgi:hypothetical protein